MPVAERRDVGYGGAMRALRHLLKRSPLFAALLVVTALAARFMVPAGYMPAAGAGGATLTICTGYGPMRMDAPRATHRPDTHGDAAGRCAFADLAVPAIGGADAIQLAAALLFALALGVAARVPTAARAAPHLRPPPRGPPVLAIIR